MTLAKIQSLVKAPKGQFNAFGKYKYRSCEDIVEAVKPVINPLGFAITLSDEVVSIGGRVYVKATATLSNNNEVFTATAFAREEETKKGMDGSQITGAASSYARKYALNGLFAIDDTKDADTQPPVKDADFEHEVDESMRKELRNLVYSSTLNEAERLKALESIELCVDNSRFFLIKGRLEDKQQGYNEVVNPSATDAKNHVKKIVG